MNPRIDKWLDEHEDELIGSLRESIRIPSVKAEPGMGAPFGDGVKLALTHVLETAERMGFTTCDMDGYIGLVDYGAGAETLGVMAHLDVVPEGDGWDYNPFGGELVEGRILGRGAMDNKGPVFASLYALRAIKECGIPLKRKIRLMLGCDEESGWGCMDYYKKNAPLPELAFSPDAEYPVVNSEMGIFHGNYSRAFASKIRVDAGTRPNVVPGSATAYVPLDALEVCKIAEKYAQRSGYPTHAQQQGNGTLITVTGLNAHASMPHLGKNALSALLDMLTMLPLTGEDAVIISKLNAMFKYEYHGESMGLDHEDVSGRLTLNIGVMHWDEKGIHEFAIDIRHPISLSCDEVRQTLSDRLSEVGLTLCEEHVQNGHYVAPESELVSKLLDVYAARTGTRPEPLRIGGGTYARAMDNAVAFGCERKGINNAIHMPNEFLTVEQLMDDAKMIADAMIALAAE
ncbi:MAG: Sapep family Mn(2+)-dependent dipeptidase [Clostridia bacterium]